MSERYKSRKFFNTSTVTTATAPTVQIGPVDISSYNRFALLYQNSSASPLATIAVQVADDPDTDNSPSNWVTIPTATLPQPSALAANTSVVTAPVDNAYNWLRVTMTSSATNVLSGTVSVTIMGKQVL